ncbi:MAG: hypothetical protein KTR21_02720 [Rhodobacteraceae bacterium]|nr:hypothetical protein [Paracoccaceae bacterium]
MRARHRRAHRTLWMLLAVLLPAILIAALALRQDFTREIAPERLDGSTGTEGGAG